MRTLLFIVPYQALQARDLRLWRDEGAPTGKEGMAAVAAAVALADKQAVLQVAEHKNEENQEEAERQAEVEEAKEKESQTPANEPEIHVEYVEPGPAGLFPRPLPIPPSAIAAGVGAEGSEKQSATQQVLAREHVRVCRMYSFLGRFVAQALLDGRLLDLPLSRPFLRTLLCYHQYGGATCLLCTPLRPSANCIDAP